jgi:hypothetical protein
MNLPLIRERLTRRLCVNYIAYMGQPSCNEDWLQGYFQAKKEAEEFLKQLEIYEPYDAEESD